MDPKANSINRKYIKGGENIKAAEVRDPYLLSLAVIEVNYHFLVQLIS